MGNFKNNQCFNILGYIPRPKKAYDLLFFLKQSGTDLQINASELTKPNLCPHVCSSHFLLALADGGIDNGTQEIREIGEKIPFSVRWERVQDGLVHAALDAGLVDPESVHGRGIYKDGDHYLLHTGRGLYINNKEYSNGDEELQNKYTMSSEHVSIKGFKPITAQQTHKFYDLCKMLPWDDDDVPSAEILAGWTFASYMAGCVSWRPHLWLHGPQGSGKSRIIQDVLGGLLDGFCINIGNVGSTTVAGVKQIIANAAVPVLFDEAEKEGSEANSNASKNLKGIIATMRSSASDSRSRSVVGTSEGTAKTYTVNCPFALASIHTNIVEAADETRIIKLAVDAKKFHTDFKGVVIPACDVICEKEYRIGMLLRAYQQVPLYFKILNKVHDLFSKNIINNPRYADTYSSPIAGFLAMVCDDVPGDDVIMGLLKQIKTSRFIMEDNGTMVVDERFILNTILESSINATMFTVLHDGLEVKSSPKKDKVSVQHCIDLLDEYFKLETEFEREQFEKREGFQARELDNAMRHYGCRYFKRASGDYVFALSIKSPLLDKIVKGAAGTGWQNILKKHKDLIYSADRPTIKVKYFKGGSPVWSYVFKRSAVVFEDDVLLAF